MQVKCRRCGHHCISDRIAPSCFAVFLAVEHDDIGSEDGAERVEEGGGLRKLGAVAIGFVHGFLSLAM